MIAPPGNTQIWIAAGVTDLRRGFTGLSALVQTKLEKSPMSGQVFIFRGRTRRSGETDLVRWRRAMFIFASVLREGVCLAASYGRSGVTDPGAVIDAVRRH